ncbi:MAG: hypothetical protein V2I36_19860 [Desulfopila sp.]|jgi:hypothetical protein|nr:hypothetical protein [Desulfopila sp.]
MKLRDFFVPKYLHSDPDVRLKFVNKSDDAHLLQQMSEKDKSEAVRKAAATKARKLEGRQGAGA